MLFLGLLDGLDEDLCVTRGKACQAKSNPADEGSLGQQQPSPVPCPVLAYPKESETTEAGKVFFRKTGNLGREICSRGKLEYKPLNTGMGLSG